MCTFNGSTRDAGTGAPHTDRIDRNYRPVPVLQAYTHLECKVIRQITYLGRYGYPTINDFNVPTLQGIAWMSAGCWEPLGETLTVDRALLTAKFWGYAESGFNRLKRAGGRWMDRMYHFKCAEDLDRACALHRRAGHRVFYSADELKADLLARRAVTSIEIFEIGTDLCVIRVAPDNPVGADIIHYAHSFAHIYWSEQSREVVAVIPASLEAVAARARSDGWGVTGRSVPPEKRIAELRTEQWHLRINGCAELEWMLCRVAGLHRARGTKAHVEYQASISDTEKVASILACHGWRVTSVETSADVERTLAEQRIAGLPGIDSPAPNGRLLREYQRQGVVFAARRMFRAAIGDEMGLGKTAQAILAARASGAARILVVAPVSAGAVWQTEILGWTGETAVKLSGRHAQTLPERGWVIASYESLTVPQSKTGQEKKPFVPSTLFTQLRLWGFDVLVIDEAHRVTHARTARTSALHDLSLHAKHVLALTGTPIRSEAGELPILARLIDDRVASQLTSTFGPDAMRAIWPEVMIRRRKCEVAEQLPAKTRHLVECEVSVSDADVLAARTVLQRFAALQRMRAAFGIAKAESLVLRELLDFVVEQGPVVVFAHHRAVIGNLLNYFRERGVIAEKLVGGQSGDARANVVRAFHAAQVRALLVSIEAGAEGIDLTCACRAVIVEYPWVPATLQQAEDRLHRYGQQLPVDIYHIAGKNRYALDIDMMAWSVLARKLTLANSILGEQASLSADVMREVVKSIPMLGS